MIARMVIALLLGLVTTYAVAVIPPNLPRTPRMPVSEYRQSGDGLGDESDGFAPLRQRSRWRDVYHKSYYDDPARGYVAAIPTPDACRRTLRAREYGARLIGRCGTGLPRLCSIQVEEWGWPMRSTWRWQKHGGDSRFTHGKSLVADFAATQRSTWKQADLTLPYGIVWPGLAVNTAAFASPWFALLFVPSAIRKLRRRRGCCGRCGYSREGLPEQTPCPECGVLPIRSDASA